MRNESAVLFKSGISTYFFQPVNMEFISSLLLVPSPQKVKIMINNYSYQNGNKCLIFFKLCKKEKMSKGGTIPTLLYFKYN